MQASVASLTLAKLTNPPFSRMVMEASSVRRLSRAAQDAPPATPPTMSTRFTAARAALALTIAAALTIEGLVQY